MSKERLEEHTHVGISVSEYQEYKELKKRVQELEQELHFCQVTKLSMDSVEKYTEDLKKQNKRYRDLLIKIHDITAEDENKNEEIFGMIDKLYVNENWEE